MTQTPLNIAHRGGADLWPENTLEAFAHAIDLGVDGLECDVMLSLDGHLVVHHDARLKAEATRQNGVFLTKPTPRIDSLRLDELQSYDIGRLKTGSAYAARRGQRMTIDGAQIPTLAGLDALLATKAKPDFRLYAELKTDMRADPTESAKLAEAYLAYLADRPDTTLNKPAQHYVISFDWRCLAHVRAARPDMPHAYTTMGFAETDPEHENAAHEKPDSMAAIIRAASRHGAPWWGDFDWRDMDGASHAERVLRAIKAAGGTGWFAYWRDVTPETMRLAGDLGLEVSAWTVNEAADMQKLAALGVTALITDRPDILKELA